MHFFSILGLDGSLWGPLGPSGTLWDPLRGSQRVPEEELKSEFNRKVARPLFRGRGGQIFVGDSLAISQQSACQQINILRYVDSRCIDCQLLYPPYFSNCAPPSEPIVALATTKWPWCSPPMAPPSTLVRYYAECGDDEKATAVLLVKGRVHIMEEFKLEMKR